LQLTCTELSGNNLWGGHTWVDGAGYTALDNIGRMDPHGSVSVSADRITHRLVWRSVVGDELIGERRSLHFRIIDDATWALEWTVSCRTSPPSRSRSAARPPAA
jgi:hypothetical protein